jgi:hypothetical protein
MQIELLNIIFWGAGGGDGEFLGYFMSVVRTKMISGLRKNKNPLKG